MSKRKRKLYLVSAKNIEKVYEIVAVFLVDDSVHTFNLSEWDFINTDREWLQFIKVDDSAMECFYTNNVIRVTFNCKEKKLEKSDSSLKPVA